MKCKYEYIVFKIIFKTLLFSQNVGASCYSLYKKKLLFLTDLIGFFV